jgi:C-terminal processing protease CtpA/Prc
MNPRKPAGLLLAGIAALALASCQAGGLLATPAPPTTPATPLPPTAPPAPTAAPEPTKAPPAEPEAQPQRIRGTIEVTNPFIQIDNAEPFVLLEDESGFAARDHEHVIAVESQVLGPITVNPDGPWTYELSLPAAPAAPFVDVDNDGESDTGVQVFAIAYWINIFGDPFLEPREAYGWSTAYSSALVDSGRDDEIVGGKLLIWAPDGEQAFPVGFGDDGLLFTEDDPVEPVKAGYTVVDLDSDPFEFSREPEPEIPLYEGSVAVHDLSGLSYTEAFEEMWATIAREYPFTELKDLDWQAIHDEIAPRVQAAEDAQDPVAFYLAIRDFTWLIPDGHVGANGDDGGLFLQETSGGLGFAIRELDDGRVIVTLVLEDTPAAEAGIQVGAEVTEFNGLPIGEAIEQVQPWSAPFSTEHVERLQQLRYLLRSEVGTEVEVTYQNPGAAPRTATLTSIEERASFNATSFFAGQDPLALPVEARILESGLGYVRVTDLVSDSNLIARLWERAIRLFIENGVPGVIVDLRVNNGGSGLLANALPGYFIDEEVSVSTGYYYSDATGEFEPEGVPDRITPGPFQYEGPIAVLVGPACSSACEGLAYNLQLTGRATVVGQYPSGGLFGEVGRGQYFLPEGISLQAPTGRPVAPDGSIVIENTGVVPDVDVPVDEATVLAEEDVVLQAAEAELLGSP